MSERDDAVGDGPPADDADVVQKMAAAPVPEHMLPQREEDSRPEQPTLPAALLTPSEPDARLLVGTADPLATTQPSDAHRMPLDEEALVVLAENEFTGAHANLTPPTDGLSELARAALMLLTLSFPVLGGGVIAATSIDAWYAPITPMLLYALIVMPIAVALRQTLASERIEAPVPRPGFMAALLIGALTCSMWAFEDFRARAFLTVEHDVDVRRSALSDPSSRVAGAACQALLSDNLRPATLKLVTSLSDDAIRSCLRKLPRSAEHELRRQIARRFESRLSDDSVDGLTCHDVDLVGQLPSDTAGRDDGLWTCVAQDDNEEIRACCAEQLLAEATLGLPDEVTPTVTQWLLATTFHGQGVTATDRGLARRLGLSPDAGGPEVLRLACSDSFRKQAVNLLGHVSETAATCPHLSADVARAIEASDWFAICGEMARDGYDNLCSITDAHMVRTAVQLASSIVGASTTAYEHGAFRTGIQLGDLAEEQRLRDPAVRMDLMADRVSKTEQAEHRDRSLESIRELEREHRAQRRADGYLRGFAPPR